MFPMIKVQAKGSQGTKDYQAIVFVDHIGSIIESTIGCQIVCKNGDILPLREEFEDVEEKIKKAFGGTGQTLMV